MNTYEKVKKSKISYNGIQVIILNYLGMRKRMKKPVVLLSEIMAFNKAKFVRKDSVVRTIKNMIRNGFIEEKDDGYIVTIEGEKVPAMVVTLHMSSLSRAGKRVNYANDELD